MPVLYIQHHLKPIRDVDATDGLTVGRDARNTIVLDDPEVAPYHARLFVNAAGEWVVISLTNTHPMWVNEQPRTTSTLTSGDRIQIGHARITFVNRPRVSPFDHPEAIDPGASPPALDQVIEARRVGPTPAAALDTAAARKLKIFYEFARAIGQPEDTDALLGRMLEAILDVLKCERGVVALCEPGKDPGKSGEGLRRVVRARGPFESSEIILSRALVEAALVRREGVIAANTSRTTTLVQQNILAAMIVPLALGEHVLGLIYVDDRGTGDRFASEDLDFLGALASITAATLDTAERYQRMAVTTEVLRGQSPSDELIGEGEAMRELKTNILMFAASPTAHVLIRGESGTGKELVARTLHTLSPRAERTLVMLNCAAMPETIIESALFGHKRGAFTGATSDKRGMFVLADKGTLFLDEIGDLSLMAQAKVLRAVQQGEVQPLGSEKTLHVDVRILSATHKDLAAEVAAGRFREDLFYRLKVLELTVPPLRDRTEDIPLLARRFLAAAAMRMGKRVSGFTPRALSTLARYRFPGNVRELQNEVERAAIVVRGGGEQQAPAVVDIGDLSALLLGAPPALAQAAPLQSLEDRFNALEPMEKALVVEALEAAKGNITEAGRLLGISYVSMKGRMKRFGLLGTEPKE